MPTNNSFAVGQLVKYTAPIVDRASQACLVVAVVDPWTWEDEGLDAERLADFKHRSISDWPDGDERVEWDELGDFFDAARWDGEREGLKGLKLKSLSEGKEFYLNIDNPHLTSICQENVKNESNALQSDSKQVTL